MKDLSFILKNKINKEDYNRNVNKIRFFEDLLSYKGLKLFIEIFCKLNGDDLKFANEQFAFYLLLNIPKGFLRLNQLRLNKPVEASAIYFHNYKMFRYDFHCFEIIA